MPSKPASQDAPRSAQRSSSKKPAKGVGMKCPICGDPAADDGRYGPFCSSRCQMVDLGRWMGERYVSSRPFSDPLDEEEDG
ncbi:MAG: DNA gyrase inhibitor YacG [Planctomycetota bacterium]